MEAKIEWFVNIKYIKKNLTYICLIASEISFMIDANLSVRILQMMCSNVKLDFEILDLHLSQ